MSEVAIVRAKAELRPPFGQREMALEANACRTASSRTRS